MGDPYVKDLPPGLEVAGPAFGLEVIKKTLLCQGFGGQVLSIAQKADRLVETSF